MNNIPIEQLVIQGVRNEISADDVFNSAFSAEDFRHLLLFLVHPFLHEEWKYEEVWDSESEKRKMISLCYDVINGCERRDYYRIVYGGTDKPETGSGFSDPDWETQFSEKERVPECLGNAFLSLERSLSEKGRVSIPYISFLSGYDPEDCVRILKGKIFQDPQLWQEKEFCGYVLKDEYICGNLHRKIVEAEAAEAEYPGRFSENIVALKKAIPSVPELEKIYITMGSPLVENHMIDRLASKTFGLPYDSYPREYKIRKSRLTGEYEVSMSERNYPESSYVPLHIEYGTPKVSGLANLEHILNGSAVQVNRYEYRRENGKVSTTKTIDREETIAADEKKNRLSSDFMSRLLQSENNRKIIIENYVHSIGCYVKPRRYDGSFLELPGINKKITLKDGQKEGVAKIVRSRNTLLCEEVGYGKTYMMIAGAMELKRIYGKRTMIVVPNNVTAQWSSMFSSLYPNSNVMVISPKEFALNRRQSVLERIRDDDSLDSVVIASSCFDLIPMSCKSRIRKVENEIREIYKELGTLLYPVSSVESMLKKKKAELRKLRTEEKEKGLGICFDELNIDSLFVDEAHNYKNVTLKTGIKALGINAKGSRKSDLMLEKTDYINSHSGKIVFATATPISNSVAETYTMMRYLQPEDLKAIGVPSFDTFVSLFAETKTEYENDVDAKLKIRTRLVRFHNLKELTSIFGTVCDAQKKNEGTELPSLRMETVVVDEDDETRSFMKHISRRCETLGREGFSRDNMLSIITDASKFALDRRLIDEELYCFLPNSKVAKCAERVLGYYHSGMEEKTTQLVFCDSSVPKKSFNMYDELARLLVEKGIPREQIAFVHDVCDDKARHILFEKVRQGSVRVLVASTKLGGTGVNVQDRAVCVHNLDIPWKPSDLTQRIGRVHRPGNRNSAITVINYTSKGTVDAFRWQTLYRKQRFIDDFLSGVLDQRDSDDIGDINPSYADLTAVSLNDPRMKERIQLQNQIDQLRTLNQKNVEQKEKLQKELDEEIPMRLSILEDRIAMAEQDLERISSEHIDAAYRKKIRKTISRGLNRSAFVTETKLVKYRGFDIMLPQGMNGDRLYVVLKGCGRYQVELAANGNHTLRIDNFLRRFPSVIASFKEKKTDLEHHMKALEEEIGRPDDTQNKIAALATRLNALIEDINSDYATE